MAPDTVSLRYFLVLAQELNFTRAAARIGIAQPALSARMRRLEAELGTALLVRNTRSVVLTTAGAALAESAPPALAALDRAWDTARSAAAGELGTLRIGYSLSAGAETAPALVDRLIRSSPGLEVGAVPMATPEISPAVADGRIDAGITRGEQPGRGVRRFLLRRARIGVQLAQHHPLAEHPEIEIADAAAYPLRLPDRAANPVIHDQLSALFRDTRPPPRFHTPAVSFDMSQRDLHDRGHPRPGRRSRGHYTTGRSHLATAAGRAQPDDPPGPPTRAVATTPPHPCRRQNPGARAAVAAGLTRKRSSETDR